MTAALPVQSDPVPRQGPHRKGVVHVVERIREPRRAARPRDRRGGALPRRDTRRRRRRPRRHRDRPPRAGRHRPVGHADARRSQLLRVAGPHPRLRRDRLHRGRDGQQRQQGVPEHGRPEPPRRPRDPQRHPDPGALQHGDPAAREHDDVGGVRARRPRPDAGPGRGPPLDLLPLDGDPGGRQRRRLRPPRRPHVRVPAVRQRRFGQIAKIDYDTGNLLIDTGDSSQPAVVQINDPKGRFGRAQSPDERFAVDDANPTIHAGTGYPMCVPRWDPSGAEGRRPAVPAAEPARRSTRARRTGAAATSRTRPPGCRPAATRRPEVGTGVLHAVRDARGPGRRRDDHRPRSPAAGAVRGRRLGELLRHPDARQRRQGLHLRPHRRGQRRHLHAAGTWPSYIALGEFGVGTADPDARAPDTLTDQEALDRIFLEAETTDIGTMVDAYYMDVEPTSGAVTHRWLTPMADDGHPRHGRHLHPERRPPAAAHPAARPARAHRPAQPAHPHDPGRDAHPRAARSTGPTRGRWTSASNSAATQKTVANGLVAGQYYAPVFDYIFPENCRGDPVVPFDLAPAVPALRRGANEASSIGPGVGPLEPAPW